MPRAHRVAILVLCVFAPSPLAAQAEPDSTEHEILALHRQIREAMFRGDPGPFARAALENVVVVPPGGHPESKEQVIRGAGNFRIDSVGYSEEEVRVRGGTAVLTSRLMLHGAIEGIYPGTSERRRVDVTGPVRQTAVYVRDEGRWRLFAQSTTPIRLPERVAPQSTPRPPSEATPPTGGLAAVEREVREALLAEQRAFTTGGCAARDFFSDDAFVFVVDGRTREIEEAPADGRACGPVPASGGTRPRRTTERHDVHALGPSVAHTVTHYANQIPRPDGSIVTYPSVVTKIWTRQGDSWRIVHFHESSPRTPSP